jgi:FKBP-type peptidyl-prolyl cis-trans isomerase
MKLLSSAVFATALLVATAASAQVTTDPSLSAEANAAFLANNAKQPGVMTLDDGVQYSVVTDGTGMKPDSTDTVQVLYTGMLINGKVFDQTGADPRSFLVYQLIPGWVAALTHMHKGSHWRIVIPANVAYGAKGAGNGLVPPDQTLIFDMTLVSVRKGG